MAHEGPVGAEALATAGARRDHQAAGAIIGAHSLKHVYQQGFYVVLPEIYAAFGLSPVAAGLLDMVRRSLGGATSLFGGILLDRYRGARVGALYASLMLMGAGYFLLGVVPTYVGVIVAVAVAGAAASVWHPAALGLLGEAYPDRRGFVLSMHRSTGSVGDVVGPVLVGVLLATFAWQYVLYGALPLAIMFTVGLWLFMRRAPHLGVSHEQIEKRKMGELGSTLVAAIKDRDLLVLLSVSALNGIGQGSLVLWLSLYLYETQGMGSVGIGIHIALLTGFGIFASPFIGMASDRIGRRAAILGVLIAKSLFSVGLALTGSGWVFTAFVALIGSVLFATSALFQATALDLTEGQRIEGSMIGLMWGINAVFVGLSPLLVGVLVEATAYIAVFWFVAVANLAATAGAWFLPKHGTIKMS